ncbi:pyruvate dehydrogenase (acetyl-transferring), homodimeric type [Rubinisphaera italica]|uniref:Pyruvate dehydrogenase E1 component n=1 Tax=Rubinisphaera italica TaxID=2527969 RepID=A0A5C5XD46_9PLAN|nr:pyruvate dehydrogenase (acetyl-transferring), homodimeric type [Rubinisphaera italica]TWT59842.1 Pyruvate dehydrogenase E1 component [Rubinisphaera italica]
MTTDLTDGVVAGIDPVELEEWYQSLEDVIHRYGPERVTQLLVNLRERAYLRGVMIPFSATTPYINTIDLDDQPAYPGNLEIERRIKSIVRWNALAMVHGANKKFAGLGGHISTFASSATLYEVAQNHFFRGRTDKQLGDMVYFQGHASPGMYARAFVEGRLDESHLERFRREIPRGEGLCSYPHPWLMPNFWQFPTVSMGLGPITAIYHARFLKYLEHRGLLDTSECRVWAFLGDGECDEPESLGALTLASREKLDNLTFVINCNLQRLDGPVRGNGKIIQELEGAFRGAGWNALKVIWGGDWDPILAKDVDGRLVKRMGEIIDGQYQKYSVEKGDYIRDHFFGADPELLDMVDHLSDEQLQKLRRGGHDPSKVYAAYKAAVDHVGAPTVILAKTIKGYGLGESGEGRNNTHNEKKINEKELINFRTRFGIPLNDEEVLKTPFYRFEEGSEEQEYLKKRREELGGYVPSRQPTEDKLNVPDLDAFSKLLEGSDGKDASTTMVVGQMISMLLKDKEVGKRIVPIIPDEARTFGMEGLFKQCGIYSSKGQLYEPVDRAQVMYYKEAEDGQLLEEGINEAGAMSSFVAAGTAYANLGLHMIPFYIFYSMFGFQRVGDLIWLAGDARTKGFLVGGTSGRTTLNGEGLQHEDGHSQLVATTVPNLVAYDPAYSYELAVIIQNGMQRMYADGEDIFYYISVYNGTWVMPAMPEEEGVTEGILKGMYKLSSNEVEKPAAEVRPQLFGSGPILEGVLDAQKILAEKYNVATDVWSVTSYSELCRDARAAQRWNRLHPESEPKKSYLETTLEGIEGPFIASSDNVRLVHDQIRDWMPGTYLTLGTDGFGRSDTREALRHHFEVDASFVTYAALAGLVQDGHLDKSILPQAIKDLGIDPDKVDPLYA